MAAYIDRTDVARFGVKSSALSSVSDSDVDAQCEATSRLFDGYLRKARFDLPLVSWEDDVRMQLGAHAAFCLIGVRGATAGGDANVLAMRYEAALEWMEGVAAQRVSPGVVDSSAAAAKGEPTPLLLPLSGTPGGW